MRILSNRCFVVLVGMASMASCSRPVAYLQPAAREHIVTQPQINGTAKGAAFESSQALVMPGEPNVTSVEPVAQARQVVSQVEAYVRNDAKLVSNQKLVKRLAHLNERLGATSKTSLIPSHKTTEKLSFMERTMLKKIDKKIKRQLAPDQTKAMNSNVRLGIIIGVVGLILLIIGGGFLTVLGIIGLVVGIVLIVLGYLNS